MLLMLAAAAVSVRADCSDAACCARLLARRDLVRVVSAMRVSVDGTGLSNRTGARGLLATDPHRSSLLGAYSSSAF